MNKKLRIAYLSDYPFAVSYGGKEIQMLQYFSQIKRDYSNELEVKLLDYFDLNDLSDVDVLHFFGYSNWYHDITKLLKSKFPNLKLVISPTLYLNKQFSYKILSFFFRKFLVPNFFSYKNYLFQTADKLICNSKSEKEQLKSIFPGIKSDKISILHNGIEKNFIEFQDANNKDLFLKKFNIESQYILSVSFLDERKNSINLIESFLQIKNKINHKLILIGKNRYVNLNEHRRIEELINSNKDRILHIDFLDRNSDLFKSAYINASVHILPSFLETPGITNLEAAALGVPLIIGNCKPVKEYFEDMAVYVNPYSKNDISQKILNTLTQRDNSKSNLLKEKALINYTIERITENLVKIYKSL